MTIYVLVRILYSYLLTDIYTMKESAYIKDKKNEINETAKNPFVIVLIVSVVLIILLNLINTIVFY